MIYNCHFQTTKVKVYFFNLFLHLELSNSVSRKFKYIYLNFFVHDFKHKMKFHMQISDDAY